MTTGHITCTILWSCLTSHHVFCFSLAPTAAAVIVITANFLMVVSPAVLAHDVSARAGDVSMGIAVFPIGWIYSGPFEKLSDG